MRYAEIRKVDTANGPGVRVSLFVSGCTHACPGCFNPEAWDFRYGQPFTQPEINVILNYLNHPYIKGFSLLGGEPLHPRNQDSVLELLRQVRRTHPKKDVWCYTGYLFENLLSGRVGQHSKEILESVDVLVDGPFIQSKKNLSLRFRGSENQRIILVAESIKENKVVLWNE